MCQVIMNLSTGQMMVHILLMQYSNQHISAPSCRSIGSPNDCSKISYNISTTEMGVLHHRKPEIDRETLRYAACLSEEFGELIRSLIVLDGRAAKRRRGSVSRSRPSTFCTTSAFWKSSFY